MLMDGRAQVSGIQRPGADATLLLIVNAHHDSLSFTLPQVPAGEHWNCLIDTDRPQLRKGEWHAFDTPLPVSGRSLVLLELHPEDDS
jgi:glycogen operon protein